jgi:prepilin-type N-terminal cleavage/methylation domain-containing protein
MKTPRKNPALAGFTLMELMVAMAITTIIVTVLVSITSIAMDTWNRSRSEIRAARQGKAMIDAVSRDLECLVTRRGNEFEWLSVLGNQGGMPGPSALQSTNAAKLVFFSASTDRYNGEIGIQGKDLGGDVSCVSYVLDYKDPITGTGTGTETFVLNRLLVNPDETFLNLLGKDSLDTAFASKQTELKRVENFVCENVYQFTLTFHVEVNVVSGTTTTPTVVPVTVGQGSGSTAGKFLIKGTGIETDFSKGSITQEQLKAGRLKAVEVSLTVLSDAGVDQLRRRPFGGDSAKSEFMAKNAFHYSKLIQLPSM